MLQAVVNTRRVSQGDPTRCLADESSASILRVTIDAALAYEMPYLEVYQADLLAPEVAWVIQHAAEHLGR